MLEAQGKNPFVLDSKEPNWDEFDNFLKGEVRYTSLMKAFPAEADTLFKVAKEDAEWRYKFYKRQNEQEW
jgi:pyruvate-ferredoxin/flavodoxin oxidoreductase